eukprot:CAMPEP_0178936654 /NCGR_PEP_ID=MMETSP0786-20121207/25301_1 /TAXON_ID=186022 /ORGANISM="Thalassionema frauenfeldii, Strain CCMP 1798" /LENGTH=818 /DNA_ID=CAMNT_0020615097 /DNA_START=164 /DNA_END=2620 /DNA_ORIENTATION=-
MTADTSSIILSQVLAGEATDARSRIEALSNALSKMKHTTSEASRCCEAIAKRSTHLDSLTSPASDASAMLSQSASNLASTLAKLKDARDKFETVRDCEPAIDRLRDGIRAAEEFRKNDRKNNLRKQGTFRDKTNAAVGLSEQDVYAAADSMEILRDAFDYFLDRKMWRSTPAALQQLERVHKQGVTSMCTLVTNHLITSGQAIRLKRSGQKDGPLIPEKEETAKMTRDRLTKALQNRDLLKSIGEYEEQQPVESRSIREMRAIFECLEGDGHQLGPPRKHEPSTLASVFGVPANRVIRTEKVGSGGYSNFVKKSLKTGFPQLDAYGEARKEVAFKSVDGYYRRIKAERKKRAEQSKNFDEEGNRDNDADIAARDAVRCLEHAMVVVAGEKMVYKAIIAPSLVQTQDEDAISISPFYRKACVAAYSHVVAAIVDRTMDIIETVFLKEGGIGQSSGAEKDGKTSNTLKVRTAASAAAAGLRMLDGVRMLGPSLAKLCDMPIEDPKSPEFRKVSTASKMSVASTLCIAIHRTTVKNCAKTLENLAKAIQEDPNDGPKHRPVDARLASVSSDMVRVIRIISPFVSAYKSVTKRRALPWDPNIGDEAGEMDSYVRFLIMRILSSLQTKAQNYTKNQEDESGEAKSNMFMINNTYYLLKQLVPNQDEVDATDVETYTLDGDWFKEKLTAVFKSEKTKYLAHWEVLNAHLTSVENSSLEYQKNKNILSLESGRLLKERFKGFNDEFQSTYEKHNLLSVIDPNLCEQLQGEVKNVFLRRYENFFDKYSKLRFSKKKQDEYLKYPPSKVESMLNDMYGGNLTVEDEP